MERPLDGMPLGLAREVEPILGQRVVLEPLSGAQTVLVDSTSKYLIRGNSGVPRAVVLCSAPGGPEVMAQAMAHAAEIKQALGESLGRHVMLPLGEGRVEGRSFAVLPYCTPLYESGILRRAQLAIVRPRLVSWLAATARKTAVEIPSMDRAALVDGPLRQLCADEGQSDPIRRRAEDALDAAASGRWTPKHVFTHHDFWTGNVLIDQDTPGGARLGRFQVIDWGGARLRGYPLYDFVRLSFETRLTGRAFYRALARQCEALECDRLGAEYHFMCAAADAGTRLENWPRERYLRAIDHCFRRLTTGH